MKTTAGITLIELMVVVAILAVISAIALPAYRNYVTTSHYAECQTEAAAIKLAQEEFFLQNSSYFGSSSTTSSALQSISSGIYKASPENYRNCVYSVTASGATYRIRVTGSNAIPSSVTVLDYSKN